MPRSPEALEALKYLQVAHTLRVASAAPLPPKEDVLGAAIEKIASDQEKEAAIIPAPIMKGVGHMFGWLGEGAGRVGMESAGNALKGVGQNLWRRGWAAAHAPVVNRALASAGPGAELLAAAPATRMGGFFDSLGLSKGRRLTEQALRQAPPAGTVAFGGGVTMPKVTAPTPTLPSIFRPSVAPSPAGAGVTTVRPAPAGAAPAAAPAAAAAPTTALSNEAYIKSFHDVGMGHLVPAIESLPAGVLKDTIMKYGPAMLGIGGGLGLGKLLFGAAKPGMMPYAIGAGGGLLAGGLLAGGRRRD